MNRTQAKAKLQEILAEECLKFDTLHDLLALLDHIYDDVEQALKDTGNYFEEELDPKYFEGLDPDIENMGG